MTDKKNKEGLNSVSPLKLVPNLPFHKAPVILDQKLFEKAIHSKYHQIGI